MYRLKKLQLPTLASLFLFFVLCYGEANVSLLLSPCSFVKLRVKASYSLVEKDSEDSDDEKPVLLSVTAKMSPPASPRPPRLDIPAIQQKKSRLVRMTSWPPTGKNLGAFGGMSKEPPGNVKDKYKWPPESPKKRSTSAPQDPSRYQTLKEEQLDDNEDLFTAIRVQVREDISDDLSKLAITSDSDSDSDSSRPGTPLIKESLTLEDGDLSPELTAKIEALRVKCIRRMERALKHKSINKIINNTHLQRDLLLIPIPLLIEVVLKIFLHFTSTNLLLGMDEVKKIESRAYSRVAKSDYNNLVKYINEQLQILKFDLRERYFEKYNVECKLSHLKNLAITYKDAYLEHAELEKQIEKLSNPREGKVTNRSTQLMQKYSLLKESFSVLRSIRVQFVNCYFSYFQLIENPSRPAKKRKCDLKDLLLLLYFLTGFRGLSILAREALAPFDTAIKEYSDLTSKTQSQLTSVDNARLQDLKPIMKKIEGITNIDYIFTAVSSSTLEAYLGCIESLKREN